MYSSMITFKNTDDAHFTNCIPTAAAPQLEIPKFSYHGDREESSLGRFLSRDQCVTGMPEHPFVDTEVQRVAGL